MQENRNCRATSVPPVLSGTREPGQGSLPTGIHLLPTSLVLGPTFLSMPSAMYRILHSYSRFPLFPFRMISDTRIECRHADSQWRTSPCAPAGAHGERAESGGPGPLAVDGFLPP